MSPCVVVFVPFLLKKKKIQPLIRMLPVQILSIGENSHGLYMLEFNLRTVPYADTWAGAVRLFSVLKEDLLSNLSPNSRANCDLRSLSLD